MAFPVFVFLLVVYLFLWLARPGRLGWYPLRPSSSRGRAKRLEFTRFYGDAKYEGEPINYAVATGLRLPGAEGDGN